MKWPKRDFWLALDDDAHLERLGRLRLTPWRVALFAVSFLVISVILGVIVVLATPIKQYLPGYLKESQRAEGEETILRLDSLKLAYDRNQAYINNLTTVLNTGRAPSADSLEMVMTANRLTPDSLLDASKTEKDFVKRMQQSEKYNISILAPLAAEGMMFSPVSDESVIASDSKFDHKARVLLPPGTTVGSIADGTVIGVYTDHLYSTVIIQHPKGFISRYSGLRTVLVAEGDIVYGGQAIALAPPSSSTVGKGSVGVELWHNGCALLPEEYISNQPRLSPRQDADGLPNPDRL
ncbi:MAG: peptidoglycan DD-metalloendopeptidase family protein [Muribaculum sp.]|nr:peptidoglycan DD-metalloendopeptidase family protein [Muribaculum sp.]